MATTAQLVGDISYSHDCVWQWWRGAVGRSHADRVAVISTMTFITPTHVGTY